MGILTLRRLSFVGMLLSGIVVADGGNAALPREPYLVLLDSRVIKKKRRPHFGHLALGISRAAKAPTRIWRRT